MSPQSISDWLALAEQHERAARSIMDDRLAAGQAVTHSAFAVECALKAYIWHTQRFNRWPDKHDRRDLYTHDLRSLKEIAGVVVTSKDRHAPAWHILLQWDRDQGYDPKPTPRKVARSYVAAAFGDDGVVTWIRQVLKTDF